MPEHREQLRVIMPISVDYLDEHPEPLGDLAPRALHVALKRAPDPELQTAEILPPGTPMPGLDDLSETALAHLRLCRFTYLATRIEPAA